MTINDVFTVLMLSLGTGLLVYVYLPLSPLQMWGKWMVKRKQWGNKLRKLFGGFKRG